MTARGHAFTGGEEKSLWGEVDQLVTDYALVPSGPGVVPVPNRLTGSAVKTEILCLCVCVCVCV